MFLDMGMGWTLSKSLPYIFFLIIGIIAYWILRKRIKTRKGRLLALPVLLVPALIYFAVNPIYQGDFSNDVRIESNKEFRQFKKNRLAVIAIPGCPYCLGSIETLKKYSERTGKKVDFIVLGSSRDVMENYIEEAKGTNIKVKLAKTNSYERLAVLANGSFPAFVYRKKGDLHVWNNDGFGVRALDWIESN